MTGVTVWEAVGVDNAAIASAKANSAAAPIARHFASQFIVQASSGDIVPLRSASIGAAPFTASAPKFAADPAPPCCID